MRRIVLSMTLLMGGWTQAASLQAGVYNLDPPGKYPRDSVMTTLPQPPNLLIGYVNELRAVSRFDPKNPGSLRLDYQRQRSQLEAKQRQGSFDVADQVNLSACLIRMGEYAAAQQLLEKHLRLVPRDNSYRFLLLLNLAAACQEDDSLLQRALELQREALESWPLLVAGWNRAESYRLRRVEEYALVLLQLRNRERILRRDQPAREQLPPDLLFPKEERDLSKKVQFVGNSGEYEAGGLAWKQWDRLPPDAVSIVLQLLLWRPHDPRLLWLYGELLNARGQVDSAHEVLSRVRKFDLWRNRELDRHLRVLSDALPPYRELFVDNTGSGEERRKQALLLWLLAPRGGQLAPAIGVAANESAGMATATEFTTLNVMSSPSPQPSKTQATDAPRSGSGAILPDWRQLTVGFLTGVIVAVLGVFQWQQWRRHRRAAPALPSRTAEHFAPK